MVTNDQQLFRWDGELEVAGKHLFESHFWLDWGECLNNDLWDSRDRAGESAAIYRTSFEREVLAVLSSNSCFQIVAVGT
jgi:hypothetical protein